MNTLCTCYKSHNLETYVCPTRAHHIAAELYVFFVPSYLFLLTFLFTFASCSLNYAANKFSAVGHNSFLLWQGWSFADKSQQEEADTARSKIMWRQTIKTQKDYFTFVIWWAHGGEYTDSFLLICDALHYNTWLQTPRMVVGIRLHTRLNGVITGKTINGKLFFFISILALNNFLLLEVVLNLPFTLQFKTPE